MEKLAFLLAAAHAPTPAVIDHLPCVITVKGNYVLPSDLGSNLIEIDPSNVTIDMQGHYISGTVDAGQTTRGIYANCTTPFAAAPTQAATTDAGKMTFLAANSQRTTFAVR